MRPRTIATAAVVAALAAGAAIWGWRRAPTARAIAAVEAGNHTMRESYELLAWRWFEQVTAAAIR